MEAPAGASGPRGSPEVFGGGVVVEEVPLPKGACAAGDNIHAVNLSTPAFLLKIPDSEVHMEVRHPSSLHNDDGVNLSDSGKMKSHSPALDLDSKPALQKSGKLVNKNSGCNKKSEMAHTEVSKIKSGVRDVKGSFPELPSSFASSSVSEKNPMVKQKNSSTNRRGDKRNTKAFSKSRCDSFSLKNGMVVFNSTAGGNNFIGLGGSKSDVFDITKYVDEPSIDELLCGSYNCPTIGVKEKATTNPNKNVLQSVRSACSILQPRRVLQVQNSSETDNSVIRKDSINSVGQSDSSKGDSCLADLPLLDKVHKSDDKIKTPDPLLYKPKDILDRLALPPPKDLDVLLSDASKPISSKYITDPRPGKEPTSQRTGLPPFFWSYPFSGHKLGYDPIKLSTNRTICQGGWAKVKNCIDLQKNSADLLKDFESLKFDQSLVPSISTSGATSSKKVSSDEYSTIRAARILFEMATYSNKNRASVKLLKNPSQKASKSKATDRSGVTYQASKSTICPHKPLKARDDGLSTKKLKLSPAEVTSLPPYMAEPIRKPTVEQSSSLPSVKSPLSRKVSNANADSYGTNLVKKPRLIKTPKGLDGPGGNSRKPKPQKP